MKKLLFVALAAVGFTACVQNEELSVANNNEAIGFDTFVENATKASAYDNSNLTYFNVYGTITADNGGVITNIFPGVEVTNETGVWAYGSQYTQYWIPGFTYKFAAVVGAKDDKAVVGLDTNGMPATISTDMENQEDILYTKVEKHFGANDTAAKVSFQFAHLLSKAKFTVKNGIVNGQNFVYNVESINITNADKDAEYDVATGEWTATNTYPASFGEILSIGQQASKGNTTEVLLVPGTKELAIEIVYSLTYTNPAGNVATLVDREKKDLTAVLTLEKGNAYNFVVEFGAPGEDIKFDAVVDTWIEGNYDVNGTSVVATAEALELALASEGINTIVLASDITLAETLEIPAGKEVSLNLNGKTITAPSGDGYAITNEGGATLQITNGITRTATNGGVINGIVYTGENSTTIVDGGTFNALNGGAYVLLNSQGTLTINQATINGGTSYPIYSYNEGNKLVINNATINGTFGCINAYGVNGEVVINGGTFQMTGVQGNTSHIAYFSSKVNAIINGGTFEKVGDISMSGTGGGGVCVNGGANLTINGGNFAGDHEDVYNYGGIYSILGGTYKFQPSNVADGYKAVEIDGKYVVVANNYVADGVLAVDENTYEISNKAGLKWLATSVNGGTSFDKKTVKLTADIDLAGEEWTPIGVDGKRFSGTFDGNVHIISGLTISTRPEGKPQAALFGNTALTVVIRNLTISNAEVRCPNYDGDFYGSALIGTAYGNVTIENVDVVDSYISGNNKVGALIAHDGVMSTLTVSGCDVLNTIFEATDAADCGSVGGLIGYFQTGGEHHIANSSVKQCTFNVVNSRNNGARANGLLIGGINSKANQKLYINDYVVENNTWNERFYVGGTEVTEGKFVSPYGGLIGGERDDNAEGELYIDGELYIAPVTTAEALKKAINAGEQTIYVKGQIDLTEEILANYNGTIIGADETACLNTRTFVVKAADEAYHLSDKTINFKNITIKVPAEDGDFLKTGFVAAGTMNFDHCVFEGQVTLNGGATWTFDDCEFGGADSGAYASFVYGAKKVTFNRCSFSGVDRAAKVYGTGGVIDVEYNNCTFTSTTSNKYAVNIDASYATTTVALNGCSQTGMPGLYLVAGTKATVYVDGVQQ